MIRKTGKSFSRLLSVWALSAATVVMPLAAHAAPHARSVHALHAEVKGNVASQTHEQFLGQTLPKNKNDHVLLIGESHTLSAHIVWLKNHLDDLRVNHNLRTIGVEEGPIILALLWAYQDGKLPVPKGQEKAYIENVFMAHNMETMTEHGRQTADLVLMAVDRGMTVAPFDMRSAFNSTSHIEVMSILDHNFDADTRFPDTLPLAHKRDMWVGLLHSDPEKLNAIFNQQNTDSSDLRDAIAVQAERDIRELLKKNPEYQRRLDVHKPNTKPANHRLLLTSCHTFTFLPTDAP